jgi:hypothetical protein
LRVSNPAAISSVRHTAICVTTSALRKRDWLSFEPNVEPSFFKASLRLGRDDCRAGASPAAIPASNDASKTKLNTR